MGSATWKYCEQCERRWLAHDDDGGRDIDEHDPDSQYIDEDGDDDTGRRQIDEHDPDDQYLDADGRDDTGKDDDETCPYCGGDCLDEDDADEEDLDWEA